MAVQAKFYVSGIQVNEHSSTASQVTLGAVCRGAENAHWSSATPCGQITMSILNDAAVDQFTQGEEYLVTFTHVTKPAPGDGHQLDPITTKWGSKVCGICGSSAGWDADGRTYSWTDEVRAEHVRVYG